MSLPILSVFRRKFAPLLVCSIAAGAPLALFSGAAVGAFFQLAENSPAAAGNAYAGGAAAEDASTVWYNPAGLTRLTGSQFIAGAHVIDLSIKFNKTSATTAFGAPISGGNGGDAGDTALVPNFYYSRRIDDRLNFGLGVNAPFGLVTDYADDWVGRYHADRSDVKTINVNPAFGYRLNEEWSVGAGLNVQRLEAELTQAVDFGTICVANGLGGVCGPSGGNDGRASVNADDTSYGYNLGALWSAAPNARAGFAYRSKIKHELAGRFDITAPSNVPGAVLAGAGLVDSNAKANVTLPATLSISAYRSLNAAWAVMADVTRTYWSDLPELRIDFDSTQPDSVVTLGLKDVNRYSIGVTYAPGGAWKYRAGLALDKTPVPNAELRTPGLPDADRTWLAFGAGYQPSSTFSLDFAYAYLRVDDASVNKSTGASPANENFFRGNLAGDYKSRAHILSVQGNWRF